MLLVPAARPAAPAGRAASGRFHCTAKLQKPPRGWLRPSVTRHQSFPAELPSIRAARRFAAQELTGRPADVVSDVQLMVSELATNAIQHVMSGFAITLHHTPGEIRVEVTDYGGGAPVMRPHRPEATDGRGLRLVDRLSTDWGVTDGGDAGKTVWFTLAVVAPSDAPPGDPLPLAVQVVHPGALVPLAVARAEAGGQGAQWGPACGC